MSSTSPTPTRSYPFAIANAFTQDPFGGNPATVIFLDKSTTLTQEERLKFVNGFNQPMVVFLTPTSSTSVTEEERGPGEEAVAIPSFDIQYFTSTCEVELCGHGALAAMKVILDSATDSPGFGQNSQFPAFSSSKTHTVEFTTTKGIVISARKVVIEGEEWFEIVLPAIKVEKLPAEEEKRVLDALASAIGKEPRVKYIGKGVPPFERYLLIVLEESENLEQLRFVDIQALKATGFESHAVTTDSTSGKFPEDYITRMFAPAAGVDEDHVCGSANCVMGPYWASQKGITELKARQVSERGGKLRVGICGDKIKLGGQVRVTSTGRLFL